MDFLLSYEEQHDQEYFFNLLRDGIVLVDKEHKILFANTSALNLLGYSSQYVQGKRFEDCVLLQINGRQVTKNNSPIKRCKDKNGTYSSASFQDENLTMTRNDRSMLNVQMSVMRTPKHNQSIAYIIVFHDRSADEKIDQAKSEFIALVSHQLRTPVNIISWYVEKLLNQRHGDLNDSQKGYLSEVASSNKRVIDLVQAIVNVSRTDLNRLKHKHEQVDISLVIRRIAEELNPVANAKKISLNYNLESEKTELKDSDQELVGVIIRNIVQNAIRYTSTGGAVEINVKHINKGSECAGFTAPRHGQVISVADNGIGIPDEEKQMVFTKLYRASNVQALDVTGVGLGLYIAQNFVQELGGLIWFESEIRSGSTFYVFIPDET